MTSVTAEPARGLMVRVAHLLGCTEGQAYTAVIAIALSVTAALAALPSLDRGSLVPAVRGGEVASPAAPPPADTDTPVDLEPESAPAPPSEMADAPGVPTGPFAPPAAPDPGPSLAFVAREFGAAAVTARVADPGAPEGVAVDANGRVYVATNNGVARGGAGPSKVMRFGPGGRLEKELAVQGQSAARTAGLTGLALAPDGSVYALDAAAARVVRLDLDRGRQDTHTTFADLPGLDGPPQPRSLAVDDSGALFVTDAGQGLIWRVAPDGETAPWHVFGKGEATSATGIAVDRNGDVLVITTTPLQGSLHRIGMTPEGGAGSRKTLASFALLSGPMGLAVTPGGGIVVALAESNELVLLGSDGTERARLTADEVAEGAGVPLDGPTGIVAHGRSLLVTNQSPRANDASHWVVFDIELTS